MASNVQTGNRILPAVRVGPLRTIGHVMTELGRVYRAARRGDIEAAEAARFAFILGQIRTAIEGGELARRLDAIEGLIDVPASD
jgi:hypothetical protein